MQTENDRKIEIERDRKRYRMRHLQLNAPLFPIFPPPLAPTSLACLPKPVVENRSRIEMISPPNNGASSNKSTEKCRVMPKMNGRRWGQKNTSKIHDSHPGVFAQPTKEKVAKNPTPCCRRVPRSCICPLLPGMEWYRNISNNTNES